MEQSPISSLGDESDEAQAAADQYPTSRQSVLQMHDWTAASELKKLPMVALGLTELADTDLPYAYNVPSDFLRLQAVIPDNVKFRLDRKYLRADQSGGLTIRYTVDLTAETEIPPLLRTAISYRLAADLAPQFTTSANRAARLQTEFEAAVKVAMRADARGASPKRHDGLMDEGDWVGWATR